MREYDWTQPDTRSIEQAVRLRHDGGEERMSGKYLRLGGAAAMLLALLALAAGCGDDDGGGGGGGTIALLLPENHTPRYEAADRPNFEAKVKDLCSDCKILYSNATQDASKQQSQAEAALTQGAKVLVVDAVDAGSAGAIVSKAKAQDVPVVSYDRLITNADVDYYISFDNVQVGKVQGETLIKGLKAQGKATGPVVMLAGDPADNNAKLFKQGANEALKAGSVKIAKSYDTPGWTADKAQNEMQQAITALGNSGFAGVLAANDDLGGAAIAAMKGAGIKPSSRPTTGQDATVAGLQRILTGEQYMTVWKPNKPEADAAAEIAVALAKGDDIPSGLVNEQVNNGNKDVPSVILTPVAVLKNNVNKVVEGGDVKKSDLCKGSFASACSSAGV
jgi:D-xylose transport system substrate-binding protein